ncbi:unnamed protein product [Echinostoma caproni]|uniref:FF domain-containing protein n=1 Tax=Echinostoma caproni TaxID=27848 RepID=A0A183AXM6_9TREM|nr:unnamed protein product [Echinostoma caproni]
MFVQLVQRIIDTESLISGAFELQANGDLKQAIDDEKRRCKKWKHDRIVEDEKKRYREKLRDMLKANEEFSKIEADKSHSHLDVEKVRALGRELIGRVSTCQELPLSKQELEGA